MHSGSSTTPTSSGIDDILETIDDPVVAVGVMLRQMIVNQEEIIRLLKRNNDLTAATNSAITGEYA